LRPNAWPDAHLENFKGSEGLLSATVYRLLLTVQYVCLLPFIFFDDLYLMKVSYLPRTLSPKAVRLQVLVVEPRVHFPATSPDISGRYTGIRENGVLQISFVFPLLIIIPPLFLTHKRVSPPPEVCDSPDHAAQYHILGL
jgi:hypothetical protein